MKNQSVQAQFSRFLKEKRIEKNLKQMEVAQVIGYRSSQFVSNWERGLANPPIFVLKKLAKLYSIPDSVMLDWLTRLCHEEIHNSYYSKSHRSKFGAG